MVVARSATSPRSDPSSRRRPGRPPIEAARRVRKTHGQAARAEAQEEDNPLDKDKISYIDYKDTALLRKFISDRGKIRARRVTGVSSQQQRQIARAIKNAREMALLPYTSTAR